LWTSRSSDRLSLARPATKAKGNKVKIQDPTVRNRLRNRRTKLAKWAEFPSTSAADAAILRDRAERITIYLLETAAAAL
jgi:hypothetical protein